jgi:hypothetical protein
MKRLKLVLGLLCCGALVWTCVPAGTPTLYLNAIESQTGARIEVSATMADGTVGKGTVTLTPSSGTLDNSSLTLDAYGGGSVMLDCNPTTDMSCLTARVVAQWTPKGANAPVEEEVRLHFGTITGTGGGTGGGGGVLFDGGINRVGLECGASVPEVIATCCRTNQEFGKQQPRCPSVQMQPGATFPVVFNGFADALATSPDVTGVTYNLTFNGPTAIQMLAQCPQTATATLTADFSGEMHPVGALNTVYGRMNSRLWVGIYAGGGGVVPVPIVCTENGGYPDRLAYYVTMNTLSFSAGGKFWKSAGPETYFYTVLLGAF